MSGKGQFFCIPVDIDLSHCGKCQKKASNPVGRAPNRLLNHPIYVYMPGELACIDAHACELTFRPRRDHARLVHRAPGSAKNHLKRSIQRLSSSSAQSDYPTAIRSEIGPLLAKLEPPSQTPLMRFCCSGKRSTGPTWVAGLLCD